MMTTLDVLDKVANFNAVLGRSRGSKSEVEHDLAPYFQALAAGDFETTTTRLSKAYFTDPNLLCEDEPLGVLLDAYAQEIARQAVERWRPHLPELLSLFGAEPEVARDLEIALDGMFSWTRYQIVSDPDMFLCEYDPEWNASYANARIGEGISFVLAPLFRAAPRKCMAGVIGEATYRRIDSRCRVRYGVSAAALARKHDVITWGKVFDMLGEEGLDLQPGEVQPAQLRKALASTFENLINDKY